MKQEVNLKNLLPALFLLAFSCSNNFVMEGVSKLIHPLFTLPLPCLPHNSLFTAAMLLISYKMIYRALNSLYKLVYSI